MYFSLHKTRNSFTCDAVTLLSCCKTRTYTNLGCDILEFIAMKEMRRLKNTIFIPFGNSSLVIVSRPNLLRILAIWLASSCKKTLSCKILVLKLQAHFLANQLIIYPNISSFAGYTIATASLPTTYVVREKVMFSQVSVILFGEGGGGGPHRT